MSDTAVAFTPPQGLAHGTRRRQRLSRLLMAVIGATVAGLPLAVASGFDRPTRRTDLSDADMERVADVTRPTTDFSKAEQYEAMQAGGATSIDPVTRNSFSHISATIPFEEGQLFNARSCMNCHLNDGRGKPEPDASTSSMFLRLARTAKTPDEERAVANA